MIHRLKKSLYVAGSFTFYVRRENVLEDALKRTLKPTFSVDKDVNVSVCIIIPRPRV